MKSVRNFRGFHSRLMATSAAVFILMFTTNAFASGGLEKVIHSFTGSPDGADPRGNLISDKAGNLYGTTNFGGSSIGSGTVFEMSPPANPGDPWTETVIHTFTAGSDGVGPVNGLVLDQLGNLYGTTVTGPNNMGTIFELTPPATAGGAWTETILYIFPADRSHGFSPYGNLIFDAAGNLYGTTLDGGGVANCSCGTVFELSPPATQGGAWTQTVLYSFGAFSGDGVNPVAGLIFDRTGALYGTTMNGGSLNFGTVFQLLG